MWPLATTIPHHTTFHSQRFGGGEFRGSPPLDTPLFSTHLYLNEIIPPLSLAKGLISAKGDVNREGSSPRIEKPVCVRGMDASALLVFATAALLTLVCGSPQNAKDPICQLPVEVGL